MKLRASVALIAACVFLAKSPAGTPALCSEPEEESFFTFVQPAAPAPRTEESVIVQETRVNAHLVVLAYRETDDGTWTDPDMPAEGPAVPRLYQNDYQGAVCEYDGEARSVATSGCGAACLSMALYYLLGDTAQTPATLMREACMNGWYQGNGLSQKTIVLLAQAHGLEVRRAGKSVAAIKNALQSGFPVIVSTGEGYFGKGHYILLRGITQDGMLYVNDPNSPEKSASPYPLHSLNNQLAGAAPLIILSLKDGQSVS